MEVAINSVWSEFVDNITKQLPEIEVLKPGKGIGVIRVDAYQLHEVMQALENLGMVYERHGIVMEYTSESQDLKIFITIGDVFVVGRF